MMTFARRPLRVALAATAVIFLGACSDSTGNRVGPAAHVDVVSGDAQTGTAGAELAQPLVVRVTDASGRPVPGQAVSFVVTSGGGHVFAGSSVTNADGVAQERWTLGTAAADSQRVEARAVNNTTGQALVIAVFHATARAAAAAALEKVQGDAQTGSVAAALPVPLKVRVRDAFGNPVAGATVAWTGPGSFAPATSATGADGTAQTTWTLGTTAGAQTATATSGGLQAAFTATATTGPGVPGRLVLSTHAAQVAVGAQTAPFTAVWRDVYGNTTPVAFTWELDPAVGQNGGGGTLAGTSIGTTPAVARSVDRPESADTLTLTVVSKPGRSTLNAAFRTWAAWGPTSASYWVAGTTFIARSAGGATPVESEQLTVLNVYGLWGSSANDVYAVGQLGLILHYDGTQWSQQTSVPGGTSDTLYFVSGRSASDVYAVGSHGRILHNTGSGWTAFASPTTASITRLWVAPTGEVFVAAGATVYRYASGAWTSSSPSAATVQWLWGATAGEVYASAGGRVYRGNGSTWTALPPIPNFFNSGDVQEFGVPSLGYAYVVGSYQCSPTKLCTWAHRFDGTTWTQGVALSAPTGQWVLQDGSVVATGSGPYTTVVATPASPLRQPRGAARSRAGAR